MIEAALVQHQSLTAKPHYSYVYLIDYTIYFKAKLKFIIKHSIPQIKF